jgi:beta-lactamase superfamily II metal-dependent hydrolase
MAFSRRSPPKCDLIQIPHHGGQPRVAEFLADALRPNIALISAKKPEECLASWEMLRQRGVLPFVTARSGAIQVTLDPNHMDVHCFGDAPPPH